MNSIQTRVESADYIWAPNIAYGKAKWRGRIYKDGQGHFAVAIHCPNGGKRTVASLKNISEVDEYDLHKNPAYRNPCDAVWRICSLAGALESRYQFYENEIGTRIEKAFAVWSPPRNIEGDERMTVTYQDEVGYFSVTTRFSQNSGHYEIVDWTDVRDDQAPAILKTRLFCPVPELKTRWK